MRSLEDQALNVGHTLVQQTLDFYAPLATWLGIWHLKWQLEDLALRFLDPEAYQDIVWKLASRRVQREFYIAEVCRSLRDELTKEGIQADITGRPKHIYSIYRKMKARSADISQIYDLLAIRVVVNTLADCYTVLGLVHRLWRPLPGQFDDYVACPKESGYQSLHTTVLAIHTQPLEVQIRTHEMHRAAEFGIAAHWRYEQQEWRRTSS